MNNNTEIKPKNDIKSDSIQTKTPTPTNYKSDNIVLSQQNNKLHQKPNPIIQNFLDKFHEMKINSRNLIKNLFSNSMDILKERETILVIGFTFTTFLILSILPNNLKFSIGILNVIIYLYLSNREDKLQIIFTILIIVIGGMITESSIIYFSNINKNSNTHTLTYSLPSGKLNIPLWLSIPYISFCIAIIHLYKIIMKYSNNKLNH